MNKKLKTSLIQTGGGVVCMALAVPSKSFILLVVASVLLWMGGRGLLNCIVGKKGDDK